MENLDKNWITEGRIDFEYKKYLLLAYLQKVHHYFLNHRLYPYLSDLIVHHKNLIEIKNHKDNIKNNFPQRFSHIDFEKISLIYEKIIEDDNTMQEIDQIAQFAIEQIQQEWKVGKEIYDTIEHHMSISPVGISPIRNDYGYLLIALPKEDTYIYSYQVSIYENAHESYRAIKTEFVDAYQRTISNTFEAMKTQLIRKYKTIANPATFLVQVNKDYPLNEAVLPIAKRRLIQMIEAA